MSGTEPPITEWNPTPIIDESLLRGKPYRFSLVILNQPIHNIPLFLDLWRRGKSSVHLTICPLFIAWLHAYIYNPLSQP